MPSLATLRSQDAPRDFVPSDNAEVYRVYFPYIVNLVERVGQIEHQDAEDIAMTILAKFIERGALEMFDPEYVVERKGALTKGVFRAFLSSFVCTYVKHYRDKQGKRLRREPFSGDQMPGGNTEGDAAQQSWFDLHGPSTLDEDEQDEMNAWVLHERIRLRLSQVPRSSQDKCDFVLLFNTMVAMEAQDGHVNYQQLAIRLGVSKTTVGNWIRRLRPIVTEVLAA